MLREECVFSYTSYMYLVVKSAIMFLFFYCKLFVLLKFTDRISFEVLRIALQFFYFIFFGIKNDFYV